MKNITPDTAGPMKDIMIAIIGEPNTGRSTLAQLFKDFLREAGAPHVVVHDRDEYEGADPARPPGNLQERLRGFAEELLVNILVEQPVPCPPASPAEQIANSGISRTDNNLLTRDLFAAHALQSLLSTADPTTLRTEKQVMDLASQAQDIAAIAMDERKRRGYENRKL